MKDLVALARANGRPARWWLSLDLGPFDHEPAGYTTSKTVHQLSVSLTWGSTQVRLTLDGETEYDEPKEATFEKMLQRFEKRTGVTYRLDRASVSGSPAPKKAVREWLRTLRPGASAAGSFETFARAHGVGEKALRSWLFALEGGSLHDPGLKPAVAAKLLSAPHFTDCARAHLAVLAEAPQLSSRKAFKRTVRLAQLLIREADPRSAPMVLRLHRLAKGDPSYSLALSGALDQHAPAGRAWQQVHRAVD